MEDVKYKMNIFEILFSAILSLAIVCFLVFCYDRFINFDKYIKIIIFSTGLIYTLLIIFTYVLLIIDKDLGIKKKLKIKTLLYNPIYLFTFLYCMIRAMFGNISWDKIEHTGIK